MSFIYALACPKSGLVRYIGKADRPLSRLSQHLRNARKPDKCYAAAVWIRSLLAEGLQPELRILFEIESGASWDEAERKCIADHRASGCDLTNSTAGGEGLRLITKEAREAVSAAMSAQWAKPGVKERRRQALLEGNARPQARANRVAAAMNPETRAKKSAGCKVALSTPEMKQRLSEFQKLSRGSESARTKQAEVTKNAWADPIKKAARVEALRAAAAALRADPERSAKKAEKLKAAFAKPDTKARLSAAMAEVRARPEVNAKRAATMKAAWSDPDNRDKWLESFNSEDARTAQSEAQKALWSDPSHRSKLIEAQKAAWAKRKAA